MPCDVSEHTDRDLIEIGLTENLQRRDLTPLEEAAAISRYMETCGYSIPRLAERIGRDKSYVEYRVALARAPQDVKAMVAERPEAMSVAREIAKLPSADERRPLIEGVLAGALGTDQVRIIVRSTIRRGVRLDGSDMRRRPSLNMERLLASDAAAAASIVERWHHCLPLLIPEQRAEVLAMLVTHRAALDELITTLHGGDGDTALHVPAPLEEVRR